MILIDQGSTVSHQCVTTAVVFCIVSSFLTALLVTLFFLVLIICNIRRSRKSSSTNEMKTEEVVYEQVDDKVSKRVEKIEMKGNESYATIQQ